MASKEYAILDIQNDDEELQFQDFGINSGSTNTFTNYSDTPQSDSDKLLGEYQDDDENTASRKEGSGDEQNQSFWSFAYYQQFFDVDSKQVGDRIIWSMIPKPGQSYLKLHIRPKPDLYGPFWVCLTLVFAAAITGNVSNYLQTKGDQTLHWHYDFHKVSLAAGMVFSYGWLLPLVLWSVLRYKSASPPLSLLDLICVYGYSLSVLVPVCIIWTIPMIWLRWCAGIVGVVLSGVVLAKAVWEGLKGNDSEVLEEGGASEGGGAMRKIAMVMVVIVLVMHVAIAMGFMLYFFNEPLSPHSKKVAVVSGSNDTVSALSGVPAFEGAEQQAKSPSDGSVGSNAKRESPDGESAAGKGGADAESSQKNSGKDSNESVASAETNDVPKNKRNVEIESNTELEQPGVEQLRSR